MTPRDFLNRAVDPNLAFLGPLIEIEASNSARLMLMAIAGVESGWMYRRQHGGPARSYWQFEKGGGVAGVISLAGSKVEKVCTALDIPFDGTTVFEAMAWNDTLACAMARLLLWTDPAPLPVYGDKQAGWEYYLRNWRPGAPGPDRWNSAYDWSLEALR